jgi:hypothetical protein
MLTPYRRPNLDPIFLRVHHGTCGARTVALDGVRRGRKELIELEEVARDSATALLRGDAHKGGRSSAGRGPQHGVLGVALPRAAGVSAQTAGLGGGRRGAANPPAAGTHAGHAGDGDRGARWLAAGDDDPAGADGGAVAVVRAARGLWSTVPAKLPSGIRGNPRWRSGGVGPEGRGCRCQLVCWDTQDRLGGHGELLVELGPVPRVGLCDGESAISVPRRAECTARRRTCG